MQFKEVVKSLVTLVFCLSIILTNCGKASAVSDYALSDLEYKYDEQDKNGIELVRAKIEETKNLISPIGRYNWLGKYIREEDKNYVTKIGDDFSLIEVRNEETTIRDGLFSIIPVSTITYDNYIYADIPTIDLPTCISVGDYAFSNIESLTTVNMPMCEQIGEGGFYDCRNLESVETSHDYTNILGYTFWNCGKLKNFNNWENIESIGKNAFAFTNFENIVVNKCSDIEGKAFTYCKTLKSFTANKNYKHVKENTFSQCTSLVQFDNFENIEIIDESAFENTAFETINLPLCRGIGTWAFRDCDNLNSIYLPQCKEIGMFCFKNCHNLESIDLPVCEIIRRNAFDSCTKLQEIYLPKCKQIESWAFQNCSSLKKIVVAKGCEFGEEVIPQGVKVEYVDENKVTGTYEQDEIDKLTLEAQQPVIEEKAFLEKDTKTGVIVFAEAGVIPNNVHVLVSKLTPENVDDSYENFKRAIENFDEDKIKYIENLDLYSINLVDENANKIQPNGEVTVMIPIKDYFDLTDLEVLRITAMNDEIHDSKVIEKDGVKYCSFKTNHFSIYCLSDKLTMKEYIEILTPYVIIFVLILGAVISYQRLKKMSYL